MVSKFQWKPFWLATQRDPQNDWTATQNRVSHDVFAQAPFLGRIRTGTSYLIKSTEFESTHDGFDAVHCAQNCGVLAVSY